MAALNMQDFSRGTKIKYPYFKLEQPDDALQLMCNNLEQGDMPLCLYHDGTLYKLATVSISARNVDKLLKVCKVSIVTSYGTYPINSVQDYLEGVKVWIC